MEQNDNHLERQEPSWYQTPRGLSLAFVGGVAALATVWVLLWWYIDPETSKTTERKDLVIAFAAVVAGIGGVGTLFVAWQNMRTTQKTLITSQQGLKIAQQNTTLTLQNTRDVEEDRAREQALRSYLENIGELLAEEKLQPPQREAASDTEKVAEGARTVARAQTLTVLQGLNRERKRIVVQFLYEAKLILRGEHGPAISLIGADLSRADLRETDLRWADLYKTNLSGADLWRVKLEGATLGDADVQGAYLQEADLREVDLSGADLRDVKDLTEAQIKAAAHITQETKLPPDLQHLHRIFSLSDS